MSKTTLKDDIRQLIKESILGDTARTFLLTHSRTQGEGEEEYSKDVDDLADEIVSRLGLDAKAIQGLLVDSLECCKVVDALVAHAHEIIVVKPSKPVGIQTTIVDRMYRDGDNG